MVNVDEALGALRWAIAGERGGYRFYMEAAERSADSMGKSTFLDLARAEEDHLRLLLVEHESVSSGQGWVDPEEAMAREMAVDITVPLFPGDKGVLEEGVSPFGETWAAYEIDGISGDLAALEFGMEMERRFYQVYKKAAAEARDSAGCQAYEFLMREEISADTLTVSPARIPHRLLNESDTLFRFLVVKTPRPTKTTRIL